MIRKAMILTLVLAVVFCAGVGALSFHRSVACHTRQWVFGIDGGEIHARRWSEPGGLVEWECFIEPPLPPDKYPYEYLPRAYLRGTGAKSVHVPLWIPFLIFATYPTIAFIRGPVRRWRRRRAGLCAKCGYDLTGNVTGVCSECGAGIRKITCPATNS